MILLVWIILFLVLLWLVMVISYWEHLLRQKDIFTRQELIDFKNILFFQLQKMNPHHSLMGYITFFLGIVNAWLLTLLGGLISPDTGPEPDFTTDEMPNYFFQSALFVGMLHIVWPSLRAYFEERNFRGIFQEILEHDKSFFTGISVALSSISLACWGVYHEIHFLFVLINGVILLSYAAYQIQREKEIQQTEQSYYEEESPPDENQNKSRTREDTLEI
ncbi:MAG: hypothetical protein NZ853_05605 [Leptospiraceae bacterium]|nr:hypothetical protein [Leptospiraceae bacterium]MDW7976576.1 hypothetical protein [Leptospiraceae bacterium]